MMRASLFDLVNPDTHGTRTNRTDLSEPSTTDLLEPPRWNHEIPGTQNPVTKPSQTDHASQSNHTGTARRRFLQLLGSASVIGIAGCTGTTGGSSKVTKDDVNYQDHPKNGQQCSSCRFFVPPEEGENTGKCTQVEGDIAPEAWCQVYVPQ